MDKPGISRADENRKIRRESLREELKSREYLRQIHDLLSKDWDAARVAETKAKLDAYFRLLSKTLPDVKAIELTGEDGGPIDASLAVQFVKPDVKG